MARVRGKDTKPELTLRRVLHALGYRFRIHPQDLPGKPDVVFPRRRKAIFVHGCFWHQHPGCKRATRPKTRVEFWNRKLDANIERDRRILAALKESGWDVMVVWECQLRDLDAVGERLRMFLGPPRIFAASGRGQNRRKSQPLQRSGHRSEGPRS